MCALVGQGGPSGPDWLTTALGFWSERALATGTAWAGLCLIHHHAKGTAWAGFTSGFYCAIRHHHVSHM